MLRSPFEHTTPLPACSSTTAASKVKAGGVVLLLPLALEAASLGDEALLVLGGEDGLEANGSKFILLSFLSDLLRLELDALAAAAAPGGNT
jgi:hypothetical protein